MHLLEQAAHQVDVEIARGVQVCDPSPMPVASPEKQTRTVAHEE
jgi:hypothetical protein